MISLGGALIAGGASSRFGQDKASLQLAGTSLGSYLLNEMRMAGLGPLYFNAAVALPDLLEDVQLLPDRIAGEGPLQGLASVLHASSKPVLVAACDMPGLNTEAFQAMARAWTPSMRGLVARSADGWQPLFGIYSVDLLPDLERCLALGQRALYRFIEDQKLEAWTQADAGCLVNVNTLADWEEWKSRQVKLN